MNANSSLRPFRHGLFAGTLLVLGLVPVGAATPNDDFPRFESYIKFTGQAPSVSGSAAAYQKRARQSADGAIGIEDLHILKDISKTTTLTIDGRALAGSEDYLGSFKLVREGLGSFSSGYKRNRTYYDGIGGFFPLNRAWFALANRELHIDRGNFWAEGQVALKDAPVFTLRYRNETRDGTKDSTIWGDTNLTGLPLLPASNATRKILPAYRSVDERQQNLEARAEHTLGATKLGLSLIRDWTDNKNGLFVTNFKGEGAAERVIQQSDGIESRGFAAIFTTETELSKTVTLNSGWHYQDVSTDISGSRANAVGLVGTFPYTGLAGGSDIKVYTGNLVLGVRPNRDWQFQLAGRGEDSYIKSAATFTSITQPRGQPITAPITTLFNNESSRVKEKSFTPEFNFRYTGVTRLVVYGAFSKRLTDGDERATTPYATAAPALTNQLFNNLSQDQLHYTFGSNFNVSSSVILRGELFHKDHENKFTGYSNRLGGLYVVGYQFTGYKLTAIVKPIPELAFTTRYLPQKGKMQVTTESTAKFRSMDAETHLIGESVNWNPNKAVYVQGNINVTYSYISSAYPSSANPNQRNADNNYVSGSLLGGAVLDKNTDGTLEYTYQKADNFLPELARFTQPYGASFEEVTVTVGLKHKFSGRLIGHAKLGYFDAKNDTTGGNANFRGPLAYVSLEYGL